MHTDETFTNEKFKVLFPESKYVTYQPNKMVAYLFFSIYKASCFVSTTPAPN